MTNGANMPNIVLLWPVENTNDQLNVDEYARHGGERFLIRNLAKYL